jgi:hypothetical protein
LLNVTNQVRPWRGEAGVSLSESTSARHTPTLGSGEITEGRSFPMTRETVRHLLTRPSKKLRDSLVMQLRMRPLETLPILSLVCLALLIYYFSSFVNNSNVWFLFVVLPFSMVIFCDQVTHAQSFLIYFSHKFPYSLVSH